MQFLVGFFVIVNYIPMSFNIFIIMRCCKYSNEGKRVILATEYKGGNVRVRTLGTESWIYCKGRNVWPSSV